MSTAPHINIQGATTIGIHHSTTGKVCLGRRVGCPHVLMPLAGDEDGHTSRPTRGPFVPRFRVLTPIVGLLWQEARGHLQAGDNVDDDEGSSASNKPGFLTSIPK